MPQSLKSPSGVTNMATTYKKTDGKLVVTEPVETVSSMEELLAQKKAIENEIASMDSHYQEMSLIKADQLSRVNQLIDKASELGVKAELAEPVLEEAVIE